MCKIDKKHLLQYLIQSKKYSTSYELGTYLGVSEKTIYRYIQDLNSYLLPYNIKIDSKRGLGYGLILSAKEKDKVDLILKNYKEQDTEMTRVGDIIRLLYSKSNLNIIKLSTELFLSESTLRIALDKTKKYMQKFDLKIVTKNEYLYICGSKENEIKCILSIIAHKESYEKQTYLSRVTLEELQEIQQIVIENIFESDIYISDFEIQLIQSIIAISINEIRKGSSIEIKNNISKSNIIVDNIIHRIKNNFKINEFRGFDKLIYENLFGIVFADDINKYINLKEDIKDILLSFKDVSIEHFLENEKLLNNLVFHIKKFIQRTQEDIFTDNPIIDDIKKNYPLEFSVSYYLCKEIEKKYPCCLNENEIGFITMYLATQSENMKNDNKKIIILCHYGVGTARLLKEKIINSIEDIQVVGVYPISLKKLAYDKNVDLIVSSIYLDDYRGNWIYVDDIFDEEFIVEIRKKLYINIEDSIENLKNMISSDCFFELDSKDSKEALIYLGEKMIEKGLISDKVLDEIIDRENISSTDVGHMVSVPHTLSKYQETSIIGIGKLKKPIIWGNQWVQIIFLVAFNKDDKKNLNIFRKIYHFIESIDNINNLIQDFSHSNFLKILDGGN